MKIPTLAIALSTAVIFLLPACGDDGSDGGSGSVKTGELIVEITDKPFTYDLVTKAVVQIDKVQVKETSGPDGNFLTLHEGEPIDIDLLDLTNGVTHILVRLQVPVGTYGEMRLRVVGGHLELVNGDVFSTDLGNLRLTSTSTSGLKLKIDPPVQIVSKASFSVLLDFDLTKSFHPVPAGSPLTATSYSLMPVVHATNRSETGEVRGLVSADDGTGTTVAVHKATVYLMPPGEPDPDNSVAATSSAEDGSYALIGVRPGTWDVLAVRDDQRGRVEGVEVVVGNITEADVQIE